MRASAMPAAVTPSIAALQRSWLLDGAAFRKWRRNRRLRPRHVRIRGDRRTGGDRGNHFRTGGAVDPLAFKPAGARLDCAEWRRLREPIDHVEVLLFNHRPIVVIAVILP